MKTVRIKASLTGAIPTGEFENQRPLFEIEETIETFSKGDKWVKERQKELYKYCHEAFRQAESSAIAQRIEKLRKDIRTYDFGLEKYPSVTSIIHWNAVWKKFVTEEQLVVASSQGSIIHEQIAEYIKTGKWKEPKEIPECYDDLAILSQYEALPKEINFLAFIKKYPIEFYNSEFECFNHGKKYAGRPDIKGKPKVEKGNGWDKMDVKDEMSIIDTKTGKMTPEKKISAFKQEAAYKYCEGNEDVSQIITLVFNDDTQQGYSKPQFTKDIAKYYDLFLKDRKNFKKAFGL